MKIRCTGSRPSHTYVTARIKLPFGLTVEHIIVFMTCLQVLPRVGLPQWSAPLIGIGLVYVSLKLTANQLEGDGMQITQNFFGELIKKKVLNGWLNPVFKLLIEPSSKTKIPLPSTLKNRYEP